MLIYCLESISLAKCVYRLNFLVSHPPTTYNYVELAKNLSHPPTTYNYVELAKIYNKIVYEIVIAISGVAYPTYSRGDRCRQIFRLFQSWSQKNFTLEDEPPEAEPLQPRPPRLLVLRRVPTRMITTYKLFVQISKTYLNLTLATWKKLLRTQKQSRPEKLQPWDIVGRTNSLQNRQFNTETKFITK